jgi:hypothetical protein
MRCYFIKGGHIAAVEFLQQTTDQARITEAEGLFETVGKSKGAEGFEVWDGSRLIYRYPQERPNDR